MKRIKDKILEVFFQRHLARRHPVVCRRSGDARSARLVPRVFGVRRAGDAGIRELLSVVSTMSRLAFPPM